MAPEAGRIQLDGGRNRRIGGLPDAVDGWLEHAFANDRPAGTDRYYDGFLMYHHRYWLPTSVLRRLTA